MRLAPLPLGGGVGGEGFRRVASHARFTPGDPLHIGDSVSGKLTDLDTPDRYVVFGAYGDLMSLGVFPQTAGNHSPTLEIDAPDGSVAASADGSTNALVSAFRLPSTGAYEVYVKAAQPDQLVAYTLTVGAGWILRDLDAGTLSLNTVVTGSLPRYADRQVWKLDIPANTPFTVLAQPSGSSLLDPVLEIVAPNGDQLAVAHDASPAHSALTQTVTATDAGTYLIRVSAFTNTTTGGYELIARNLPGTPTPVVTTQAIDQRIDGHVAHGAQFSSTFQGVPGQTVSIAVHARPPGSFDPLLEVYGPSGRRVAIDDDLGAGNTDAGLSVTLDDGIGTYTIRVSGYALMAGDFTLIVHAR